MSNSENSSAQSSSERNGEARFASDRQRFDVLLESSALSELLPDHFQVQVDPAEPLVAAYLEVAGESDEIDLAGDAPPFETFWRAARSSSKPVSAGAERILDDGVRARGAAALAARRSDVEKSRHEMLDATRDGLVDSLVSAVFLGILHAPLVQGLHAAADRRAKMRAAEDNNPIALAEALRAHRRRDSDAAPLSGTTAARALEHEVPEAPQSLAECEFLTVRAELTDEPACWHSLERGGAAAEAWIMARVETDFVLSETMLRRLSVLFELNVPRALRIAGALLRRDEAGEPETPGDSDTTRELYRRVVELVLAREESEVLPLLIFVMEPGGQLRADRTTAGELRGLIRESPWFRRVRRLLRHLQSGEPVLVPAGVEFEQFARSELQRLGHTGGAPDPQVMTDIRNRWLSAMHEDLLYSSPKEVPEVAFSEALGAADAGERNPGDIVRDATDADADWIFRSVSESDDRPRIVRAYEQQQQIYRDAGFHRIHERQLDLTVRDLVARGFQFLAAGDGERATLYAGAASGLAPGNPFAEALQECVDRLV